MPALYSPLAPPRIASHKDRTIASTAFAYVFCATSYLFSSRLVVPSTLHISYRLALFHHAPCTALFCCILYIPHTASRTQAVVSERKYLHAHNVFFLLFLFICFVQFKSDVNNWQFFVCRLLLFQTLPVVKAVRYCTWFRELVRVRRSCRSVHPDNCWQNGIYLSRRYTRRRIPSDATRLAPAKLLLTAIIPKHQRVHSAHSPPTNKP